MTRSALRGKRNAPQLVLLSRVSGKLPTHSTVLFVLTAYSMTGVLRFACAVVTFLQGVGCMGWHAMCGKCSARGVAHGPSQMLHAP